MPSTIDPHAEALKSSLYGIAAFFRDRGLSFHDIPITLVMLVLIRRLDAFQRAGRHSHLYERTMSSTGPYDVEPRSLEAILLQSDLPAALTTFVSGFSEAVRETLVMLEFDRTVRALSRDDLRGVLQRLTAIDLSPDAVADGVVTEAVDDLIAEFGEQELFAQFHTPRDVVRLMSELLVGGESRTGRSKTTEIRVVDPCCGTGGLLVTAVGAIERDTAVRDVVGHDVARTPVGLTRARLLLRFPGRRVYAAITQADGLAKTDDGTFDYIVANPPFGARIAPPADDEDLRRHSETRAGHGRVNAELLFLHDAVSKMRPNVDGGARAVVITSASTLFAAGQREIAIRRALLENDFVEAIIELPARLFAFTSITTFVWVLSNKKPPARSGQLLLVDANAYNRSRRGTARKAIEIDASHIDDIVRTLATGTGTDVWVATTREILARADGAIPVPRRYAERESLKQYVERVGGELVPLRDLAIATVFGRKKTPFEDAPNAIYLPLIGTARVVTSAAALTALPENYAQVILDDARALAPYVAEFLNSDRGKRVRQQVTAGVLPRITRAAFSELAVVVPSVAKQTEAIEVNTRLTDSISSFDELRTRLWRGDLTPSEVSVRLPEVREQAFSEFVETLPYPIATILWRYNTAPSDADRVDHLLNFFEALAALYCTLLLSIAERDPAWLVQVLSGIRGLEMPTFGTWVLLARRLAPAFLSLLEGTEAESRRAARLFGGEDESVPRRLLAPEILELLSTAKVHRNERAHGGIKTEETNARAHRLLQGLLATFRSHGTIWRDIALIRPGRGWKRRSRHTYDAAFLTGSRTPFVKGTFETHVALDADEIYVLFPNAEPIQLVPLLRITGREGAESCLFFSRIQDGRARFVSYHAATTPDEIDPDDEVPEYVSRISGSRR